MMGAISLTTSGSQPNGSTPNSFKLWRGNASMRSIKRRSTRDTTASRNCSTSPRCNTLEDREKKPTAEGYRIRAAGETGGRPAQKVGPARYLALSFQEVHAEERRLGRREHEPDQREAAAALVGAAAVRLADDRRPGRAEDLGAVLRRGGGGARHRRGHPRQFHRPVAPPHDAQAHRPGAVHGARPR